MVMPATSKTKPGDRFVVAQLSLFAIRASEMSDRVAAGRIVFLDGIDLLHDAAVASGLVDAVGDDYIQAIMAAAFAGPRNDTDITASHCVPAVDVGDDNI